MLFRSEMEYILFMCGSIEVVGVFCPVSGIYTRVVGPSRLLRLIVPSTFALPIISCGTMLFPSVDAFVCPVEDCLKTFKSRNNWTTHLRKQHPTYKSTFSEELPFADIEDFEADGAAEDDGDNDDNDNDGREDSEMDGASHFRDSISLRVLISVQNV